ncbi:DUF1190 domain-containing protein [Methylocystis heyeri]|nr:DUF1190 domain-containing protein [Methylocystis heyeri]
MALRRHIRMVMASTKLTRPFIGHGFPRSGRGLRVLAFTSTLGSAVWSGTAFAAKSVFFASREACVASLKFKPEACDTAFVNAEMERQRNMGAAMSQLDCVKRFRLCESRKDPTGSRTYEPSLLGVEISNSGRGWTVEPVYAVELPPGQIHPLPISHISIAPPEALAAPAPSGYEPPETGRRAEAEDIMTKARAAEDAERAKAARRERIRNAPFVE